MINQSKTLGKTSKLVLFLVVLFINTIIALGVDGNVNSFSGKANPYNLTFSNLHEINLTYNWTDTFLAGNGRNYTYPIGNTTNAVYLYFQDATNTYRKTRLNETCTKNDLRIDVINYGAGDVRFFCINNTLANRIVIANSMNFHITEEMYNATDYISIPKYSYLKNLTIDYYGYDINRTYVSNLTCYQEYANISTTCGGLANGNYTFSLMNNSGNFSDGDYTSFATGNAGSDGNVFIRYQVPYGAYNVTWRVKDGIGDVVLNISIGCLNRSDGMLVLEATSVTTSGPRVKWWCTNYTGTQILLRNVEGTGDIYEESINWTLPPNSNSNFRLYQGTHNINYSPDFLIYQNLTSTYRFYANASKINQFLQENCTCSGCSISSSNCMIPFYYYVDDPYAITSTLANATYAYGVDNCSNSMGISSNATALNVTFYDYDGNMLAIDYGSTTTYYGGSYSYLDDSLNNISLCVYPNWFNLTTETQFEYMDNTGTIYSYFFVAYLNNMTQYLKLYTQNSTTAVLFTVVDIDENPKVNYTIHVLKYNVGTGAYTTTEILKTDSQGHAIGNIVLNTAFYNFFIYDINSALVLSETGVRLTTTTYTFTISAAEDAFYTDASNAMGINYNLYFNNETNNVVFTWSDPVGTMHLACLKVDNSTYLKKETMIDTCTESTSGTIVYNIPTLQNDTTYTATGYLKYDYPFPLKTIQFAVQSLKSFFHQDKFNSLFSAMILILFGILLGLPNINFSMIYFIGMVIITATLGMWYLTMPLAGSLVILGVIVLLIGGKQQ